MYRLSCTNAWFDGMTFDSLAAAVKKCRIAREKGYTCDVLRDRDRHTVKVVDCDATEHCTMITK